MFCDDYLQLAQNKCKCMWRVCLSGDVLLWLRARQDMLSPRPCCQPDQSLGPQEMLCSNATHYLSIFMLSSELK